MKKRFLAATCLALAVILGCLAFAGCSLFGGSSTPKEYTVQYTDDAGLHTLTVTEGLMYSIETVPSKTGYDFLGLFDSESGGTQYVNASGTSVSVFSGGKNLILYPQWKAKEYTVVLDYQGGDVTGSRQVTASYGSSLPALPENVTKQHGVFAGWYTKENCGGVQVADGHGLVPVVSVVNETNFNLNSEYIYLYAGFTAATYTVTLNFGSAAQTETVKVEYDTPVTDIIYNARNAEKHAVLSWSKSASDPADLFTGNIAGDITLYAAEWAPAIELNTDGGEKLAPVVARAGATVSLTNPKKDLYKFMYWADAAGNKYTATTMPSESITLKAVWQAKLVFDANGGSEVSDISVSAGTKITLPAPEKDGCIFAGWYTADKEKYTSTSMPAASVELKAGWYKEIVDSKVTVTDNTRIQLDSTKITAPALNKFCIEIDVSKYTANGPVTIKFDAQGHYYCQDGPATVSANFYSRKVINNSYLMTVESFSAGDSTDTVFNFNKTFTVSDNFYICFWQSRSGNWASWITYFYYTITYPDTSTLHL